MSLEQALIQATEAMNRLTAALTAAPAEKAPRAPKAAAGNVPAETPAQTAATAPAATQTTAEQPAAPEKKAEASVEKPTAPSTALSVDERASLVRQLASAGHRAVIEGLLAKFGVAKVGQLDPVALADFDGLLVAAGKTHAPAA